MSATRAFMTERATFLQSLAENADDDTRRLFADWLDDHGEDERAELIRVQVELEPFRDRYGGSRATELRQREHRFRREQHWLWDMPNGWNDPQTGVSLRFRRGFPDLLRGPARSFRWFGAIRALQPTIRRVVIHWLDGWGESLAGCDGLKGIAELELACWYANADLEALARSPHLADLEVLVLWLGRQRGGRDEDLCRIAAGAHAWPRLRELVLLDLQIERDHGAEQLVEAANRQAGREIARYERADLERIPIGGALGFGFPIAGRLPDGRGVLAELEGGIYTDSHTFPSGLTVTTYDDRGAPTAEILQVKLPPALASVNRSQASNQDGRYTQHLRDAIGFEPGLIRVQPFGLGDWVSLDGFFEDWARCGYPDEPYQPDIPSCHVNGIGGSLYQYLRGEEFVVDFRSQEDRGHGKDHQERPEPSPDDSSTVNEIPF